MNAPAFNRKPLFDTVRRLLKRGFTSREVAALDQAIEDALDGKSVPDAPSAPEREHVPGRTGPAGIELMHRFEGCARKRRDGLVEAYPDPGTGGEPWTIGWGSTGRDPFKGGRIRPGTVWTQAQCDKRFEMHLAETFEPGVIKALGDAVDATSQPQFDALVSFAYNVGVGALQRSTLLRKHKAGDYHGAAREFARWNKAGGRVLKGLTRRRAAEADLYRSGM